MQTWKHAISLSSVIPISSCGQPLLRCMCPSAFWGDRYTLSMLFPFLLSLICFIELIWHQAFLPIYANRCTNSLHPSNHVDWRYDIIDLSLNLSFESNCHCQIREFNPYSLRHASCMSIIWSNLLHSLLTAIDISDDSLSVVWVHACMYTQSHDSTGLLKLDGIRLIFIWKRKRGCCVDGRQTRSNRTHAVAFADGNRCCCWIARCSSMSLLDCSL